MESPESSVHLVYLVTYWREWRPWGPGGSEAKDRIIRDLIAPDNRTESTRSKVWLARSADGRLDKGAWLTGEQAVTELDRGNAQVDQAMRRIEAGYLDAADNLQWCHVLIHPDHEGGAFRRTEAGRKPWILFDIRFLNLWNSRLMFIGVSFWVGDPAWAPVAAGGWSAPQARTRTGHEWLVGYEKQARKHVGAHFEKVEQKIRDYEAPEFWIALEGGALPGQQGVQSARHLYEAMHGVDSPRPEEKRRLLQRLFGDEVELTLSSANVCVLPARREDRTVRECYVVLPDETRLNGTVVAERLRSAVLGLLSLEALAAVGNDVRAELEIWREHAMIYQHAARTLGALWDAVASHLPIRRWARLNRAHRAVELIHLTLLQGMADLADVTSHLDELVSRIERLEHLADEQFARRLSWTGRGLREALDDVSHFTALKRFGTRAEMFASRATEQYKNLLDSMAHAFDERRVRELEVLQRAGFWLSVTVGAFAVLTFMDFFLEVTKVSVDDLFLNPGKTGLSPLSWSLAGLLAVGVLGSWAYSLWSQRMGSGWFHRTFRKLERYLRLSSTRELELLRTDDPSPEQWAERDDDLAKRFAELWDAAQRRAERTSSRRPRVPRRGRRTRWPFTWLNAVRVALRGQWWVSRDLGTQRRDIEALIVRTLLLAERTPALRRYGLPRLALLHRHCGRLPSDWFGDFDGVSRTELRMVFAAAGLPAKAADDVDTQVAERIAYSKAVLAGRVAAEEKAEKAGTEITTARELLAAIEQELEKAREAARRREAAALTGRDAAAGRSPAAPDTPAPAAATAAPAPPARAAAERRSPGPGE